MVNFEPDQAEKLAEIGTKLKQIRNQKGLSLEQISAKTMIQTRSLQAIEDGKVEQLPEPIYTQGFIRRFAEAMDLDGTQLASALPLRPTLPLERRQRKAYDGPQLRPVHLYLIYLVLIVAAVAGLSYLNDRAQEPVDSSAIKPTPAPGSSGPQASPNQPEGNRPQTSAPQSAPNPVPPTGAASPTNQPAASPSQSLRVRVSLTEDSWLEVVADGQTVFEGNLPTGSKREWSATKRLTVYAGNAGAVLVQHSDGEAKPIGAAGAVESVTFTAPESGDRPSAVETGEPSASPQ